MANSSGARSLDRIESDLDHNRERLHHTLDALEHRLAPADISARVKTYISESGSQEFVDNLQVSVTRNPLPLGLVGLGLTWLILSGTSRSAEDDWTHRSESDQDSESFGDKASRAGGKARSGADAARQGMSRAADRGREGMHSVTGGAKKSMQSVSGGARRGASRVGSASRQGATRTKNGFDYMLREEPLVSGLIALAIGGLAAASLPRSRREDEFMGDTRDRVVDSAEREGRAQADKAGRVAESALDAARDAASDEAGHQGLGRTGRGPGS